MKQAMTLRSLVPWSLFFFIVQAHGAATGGGLLFDNLHWSPDGRFLAFTARFAVDDEGRYTETFLAFHDLEQDITWSPHDGASLYVPEFKTHYVANCLGIFAVPDGGGPWRKLVGGDFFQNKSGWPAQHEPVFFLRYDDTKKTLTRIALAYGVPPWKSQKCPLMLTLQLPNGEVLEEKYKVDPTKGYTGVNQEEFLSLMAQYDVPLIEDIRGYQDMTRQAVATSEGMLVTDVIPDLGDLEYREKEFYWIEPHALVLMTSPGKSRRVSENAKRYAVVDAVRVDPTGKVKQFEGPRRGETLLRAQRVERNAPAWNSFYLYRIQVDRPADWPRTMPLSIVLDDVGKPTKVVDMYGSAGMYNITDCRGSFPVAAGSSKPNSTVFLFPLDPDETSEAGYFSDMVYATLVYFEDETEAEVFAKEARPLLQQWFAEKLAGKDIDPAAFTCRADKFHVNRTMAIAFSENHQYLVFDGRLWHIDLDTQELALVLAEPLINYAVSPDGRYIAASYAMDYCATKLVLFDVQTGSIKRIQPPE